MPVYLAEFRTADKSFFEKIAADSFTEGFADARKLGNGIYTEHVPGKPDRKHVVRGISMWIKHLEETFQE